MFNILGALSSLEREIILERTHAGLQAAAKRGRHGGRPLTLDEAQIRAAKAMSVSSAMHPKWRSSLVVRHRPVSASAGWTHRHHGNRGVHRRLT
jgi:DNA invertase Pin-like site-specific DNA recombinase